MKNEKGFNYIYVHKSEDVVIIVTALSEEQSLEILKNVTTSPDRWRLDEVDSLEKVE